MLSLGQLIASSADVESKYGMRSYSQEATFKKAFGTVYYSDKVAYYNEQYKILELRITMGNIDDANDGLHTIRMAFKDVDGTVYNSRRELLDALGFGENSRQQVLHSRASISRTTAKEASDMSLYEGIVIPCTKDPNESDAYSDYFLPSGRFFYSKTGITLNNLCAVSCSCSSYRYTFAEYNSREKAHLGPKPDSYRHVKVTREITKYNSKTGKDEVKKRVTERVFRRDPSETVLNKNKAPGLCKHLMLFALLLLSGEILKGGVNIAQLRKDIKGMEKTQGTSGQFNLGKQERFKNKVGTTENYLKIKEALDKSLRDARAIDEYADNQAYREALKQNQFIDYRPTGYMKQLTDEYIKKTGKKEPFEDVGDVKSLKEVKEKMGAYDINKYVKYKMKGAFGKDYFK